jgi:large subunit ribosomal protein L6
MSRIGKKAVVLPEKVTFGVNAEGSVKIEGPKGKLEWTLPKQIKARLEGTNVVIDRENDNRQVRALHGLSRALVANMVTGVSTGFIKNLEIQGVGFKAAVQGKVLNLSLGFSHPINFAIPEGITVKVTDNTKISVEGIDRQLVGQAAADIRAYYPPEPYKGKGVRYAGEQVLRKEGKTVQ